MDLTDREVCATGAKLLAHRIKSLIRKCWHVPCDRLTLRFAKKFTSDSIKSNRKVNIHVFWGANRFCAEKFDSNSAETDSQHLSYSPFSLFAQTWPAFLALDWVFHSEKEGNRSIPCSVNLFLFSFFVSAGEWTLHKKNTQMSDWPFIDFMKGKRVINQLKRDILWYSF